MINKIETGILFGYYGNILNDHQKDVLHLYFDMDMSLSEIADEMKISRQGVREIIVRSVDKLKDMEDRLGLVDKIHQISNRLDKIVEENSLENNVKEELLSIINEIEEI